jgi:hypothetical protein
MLWMWHYAQNESAVHQRIRSWARRDELRAMRRKGRWYFANLYNYLVSDESGLDDEEALLWLQDKLATTAEGGVK